MYEEYPLTVRPMKAIEERIRYQAVEGGQRLLDGITFDREGTLQPVGRDLLPLVQLASYNATEQIFGGAPRPGTARGNTPLVTVGILEIYIFTYSGYGYSRQDPLDEEDGRGLLEWVALVQDAIERKPQLSFEADAFLEGSLCKPVKFEVRDNFLSDQSLGVLLALEWTTQPYCRSERTENFPGE